MDYKDRIKDSPLSKLNLTLGKTEPRPAGSAPLETSPLVNFSQESLETENEQSSEYPG